MAASNTKEAVSELPNCGFHRFMDATVGTNWRTSVPAPQCRVIMAAWKKGRRFRGLPWSAIRVEVQKIMRGKP